MKHPEAQDPWRGQHPVPPVPAQPQAGETAAYPVAPVPPRNWWGRLNPLPKALLLIAAPLVLCCGGVTAVGAFSADPPKEPATAPSTVAPDTARPNEPSVTASPSPSDSPTATATPVATTKSPAPRKTSTSPRALYYANCDAVRSAGKAPLRRGAAGYRAGLDRDGDGVACESREGGGSTGGGSTGGGSTGGGNKPPATVYYKNCTAVRAAGAAPIHRGEPGYGKHLDRDGDGVGCE
jgi:uncharacterized membrane protein YgcG